MTVAGERGQASVELVALLPLLAAGALGLLCLFASGAAGEAARSAAHAGAVALAQDREAERAARAALPQWARRTAAVQVRGRRVLVRVEPQLPIATLRARLRGEAELTAGGSP